MKTYKEDDGVIYTDAQGRHIDTFVIFDTDSRTCLTHINHQKLKVSGDRLKPHPKAIPGFHLPVSDAFSFELLRKLKEKERSCGKINLLKPVQLEKAS